jgi:hypothetical protein
MGLADIYGYDLDGILCPDINVEGLSQEQLMSVVKARYHLKPLFIPQHEHFYIVTGRPSSDYHDTYIWAQNYFQLRCRVVHNSEDKVLDTEESALFKVNAIDENNITIFVESCEKIASRIAELRPNIAVLTLSDLCIL